MNQQMVQLQNQIAIVSRENFAMSRQLELMSWQIIA